jgi:hypothetical protein
MHFTKRCNPGRLDKLSRDAFIPSFLEDEILAIKRLASCYEVELVVVRFSARCTPTSRTCAK